MTNAFPWSVRPLQQLQTSVVPIHVSLCDAESRLTDRRWRPAVPRYQCYLLTPDMRVARERNFKAVDDAEALQKSRLVVNRQGLGRAFELWHGDHRIGSDFDETVQPSAPRRRHRRSR